MKEMFTSRPSCVSGIRTQIWQNVRSGRHERPIYIERVFTTLNVYGTDKPRSEAVNPAGGGSLWRGEDLFFAAAHPVLGLTVLHC